MKQHAMWMAAALLAAAPAGAQVVSGTVTNATTGNPVPHASVTVTDDEGMTVASGSADGAGRLTLHLTEGGRYVARISEPGYGEAARTFSVQDGGTFTFRTRLREVVNPLDRAASYEGPLRDTRPAPSPPMAPPRSQDPTQR